MNAQSVAVFFYGLFMDRSLLAGRGVTPSSAIVGYVDGFGLRIGRRATLVRDRTNRAYGVLMTIRARDVEALYAEASLADYVAEPITVTLPDGSCETAVCYTLPAGKLDGTNAQYASSLLALARKLELPDEYLRQIGEYVD